MISTSIKIISLNRTLEKVIRMSLLLPTNFISFSIITIFIIVSDLVRP